MWAEQISGVPIDYTASVIVQLFLFGACSHAHLCCADHLRAIGSRWTVGRAARRAIALVALPASTTLVATLAWIPGR